MSAPNEATLPVSALEALDAATAAIAAEVSLEGVLQVIADRLRPLVGATYAALGIVGPDRRIARFITSGLDDATRIALGAPPSGHGILGILIWEQQSLRLDDVMSDPRRHGFPPGHPPMHSFLGVPVVLAGRPVGNLYLTDKIGAPRFTMADQRLVETFARQAAMAMHTARLRDGLARMALLQERERIGRDLHDGIIQALYAVGLSLEDVPEMLALDRAGAEARIDRAIDDIHRSIRDIRSFIFGLRADEVDEVDVGAGLERLAEELTRGTTMAIAVDIGHEPVLDPTDARHLLQIAREALGNAARYSGASTLTVSLSVEQDVLELRIADDGNGFDPATATRPGHQGIGNMRARAQSLGATLDITSEPGSGASVCLRMPGVSAQDRRSTA